MDNIENTWFVLNQGWLKLAVSKIYSCNSLCDTLSSTPNYMPKKTNPIFADFSSKELLAWSIVAIFKFGSQDGLTGFWRLVLMVLPLLHRHALSIPS